MNGSQLIAGTLKFRAAGNPTLGNLTISDNGGGTGTISNTGNSFLVALFTDTSVAWADSATATTRV